MRIKKIIIALVFFASTFLLHAQNEISEYTKEKAYAFLTLRVYLKSAEMDVALNLIEEFRQNALSELSLHALDYEQEERILENLCFTESYEHYINNETKIDKKFKATLEKQMAEQLNLNLRLMKNRKEEQLSEWIYLETADIAAYHITKSISATFRYGFKLKSWYEKASQKNGGLAGAYISLGGWYFFAPIPFGSKKKAEDCYKRADEISKVDGERYLVYEYMSQINFEHKKYKAASKYLDMAYDLKLGSKELDKIKNCNKHGYSYYQYLRNRSGIDEKLPENEEVEKSELASDDEF